MPMYVYILISFMYLTGNGSASAQSPLSPLFPELWVQSETDDKWAQMALGNWCHHYPHFQGSGLEL